MSMIRVTPDEIRNRAELLHQAIAGLKAKVEEFDALSQALAAQWEGEARDAFVNAYTQDKVQMENFIAVMESFYQVLMNIVRNYEDAERKNVGIASSRGYGGDSGFDIRSTWTVDSNGVAIF